MSEQALTQEPLADVIRRVRQKAKKNGHDKISRYHFGDFERLICHACGSSCWVRRYGEGFAEEPADYSLLERCGE